MPRFSLESAGIMPSGGLDNAMKLSMSERAEKVIKVGVVCVLCFASRVLIISEHQAAMGLLVISRL